MSETHLPALVAWSAFALAFVFGAVANRVSFCTMGAISDIVNMGDWRTEVLEDDWTVVTADGSLSAHFEHTIAVTEHGPEVLTARR